MTSSKKLLEITIEIPHRLNDDQADLLFVALRKQVKRILKDMGIKKYTVKGADVIKGGSLADLFTDRPVL